MKKRSAKSLSRGIAKHFNERPLLDEELPRHWCNYRPKFLVFLLVVHSVLVRGEVLPEILPEPKEQCSNLYKRLQWPTLRNFSYCVFPFHPPLYFIINSFLPICPPLFL